MFEVKKTEYVNKTFRLPVELIEKMEKVAQEKGVSLNNLVVQCCNYALDNLDEEKKQKALQFEVLSIFLFVIYNLIIGRNRFLRAVARAGNRCSS